jgi:hypothetical protein
MHVLGLCAVRKPLKCLRALIVACALIFSPLAVRATTAAFDLTGPRIEMTVTRDGKTLPISQVPNLQARDRIWIHPEFPDSQSVHFLIVVAFLRGSTNPPPEEWFTREESWNKQIHEEGFVVTVPPEAQQTLLFLAPETGGDFSNLRAAVRGKPGAFVRASQDLNQASLDRLRLEKYLSEVKEASDFDPKALQERSTLLARSLSIKVDQQCFDKPTEQQGPCLTQNTDQLVLDDGHSQTMVAALTSGPSSDLIGAVSATSMAGGGFYSAYVGAIVDIGRIFGAMRNPEYQYIPALALPAGRELNLRLNNPPSFRKPKSVIVVGLPPIEAAQLPPLRAAATEDNLCLQKAPLVLPAEGAPLVFATNLAHDFTLHVESKTGAADLPATPDAARGGFIIDAKPLAPDAAAQIGPEVKATLRVRWGFDSFEGPAFHLHNAVSSNWTLAAEEQGSLIVGRDDELTLQSPNAACVESVSVTEVRQQDLKATWKIPKAGEIQVDVPLKGQQPGPVSVTIHQYGLAQPDALSLRAYAEAAHLDNFSINAGDEQGTLKGTRLDQVESAELSGVRFLPLKLSRAGQQDELRLASASNMPGAALQPESKAVAHVALRDGRVLDLQTTVEPPRPRVTLLSKSVQQGSERTPIRFTNSDELPQGALMVFFLRSDAPEQFSSSEKIEVATADESSRAVLSVSDGSLVLQDSRTVMAQLDPAKMLGAPAFGALQFRPVDANGAKGDWQTLATLVRVPALKEIRCPDAPDKQCHLIGSNLFLIDSVASDAQFAHNVPVPLGFADSSLSVPRPNGTLLFLKLRDDPATMDTLVLPVLPENQ